MPNRYVWVRARVIFRAGQTFRVTRYAENLLPVPTHTRHYVEVSQACGLGATLPQLCHGLPAFHICSHGRYEG